MMEKMHSSTYFWKWEEIVGILTDQLEKADQDIRDHQIRILWDNDGVKIIVIKTPDDED